LSGTIKKLCNVFTGNDLTLQTKRAGIFPYFRTIESDQVLAIHGNDITLPGLIRNWLQYLTRIAALGL